MTFKSPPRAVEIRRMSSLFDAIVSAITGQLGSASARTKGDRAVVAVTIVLGLLALVFVMAVARNVG
jgi:hypothetical protein